MKLDSLHLLYLDLLRDMYDGEEQLLAALPKAAKAATTPELAEAISSHMSETRAQSQRLEQIFDSLGEKPKGERCEAMKGLIAECARIIKAGGDAAVRDAGIIIAAQKIEHYEIAGYGSLCALARLLDRAQDEHLLRQTLEEEKEANQVLGDIAGHTVNHRAAATGPDTVAHAANDCDTARTRSNFRD